MSPTLADEVDPLHEYTEPINSRIFRKADALPEKNRARFKLLRERYMPLAATNFFFFPVVLDFLGTGETVTPPELPLRKDAADVGTPNVKLREIPDDILDANALRPLMEAMVVHSHRAIAEFDEVFGERA